MADGRSYPTRPILAVSAAIIRDGKVLIVRRARPPAGGLYTLPGGGVEVGESFGEALRRELAEEGRIEVLGQPALHGLFFNSHVSRRDHVAVYVVRDFKQDRLPDPNREIVASGFFEAAALPAETTEGTRLRIAEVLESKPPIATWR
jgi:ADP-ribose pyrophosphatase YjhB (NUDIX family)